MLIKEDHLYVKEVMEDTAIAAGITAMNIGGVVFAASAAPPRSSRRSFFLAGAGERIGPRHGTMKLVTVIGTYLEEAAVQYLASRWLGKSATELADSNDFFRDVVTGPFEKFTQVSLIDTLTGQEYSEKVIENCVNIWRTSHGEDHSTATEEELAARQFKSLFYPMNFPPGSTIFFTHSTSGVLQVTFSEDTNIPEEPSGQVQSRALSEAVLESIIGEHGVSPSTRRSMVFRLCNLINRN